MNKKQMMELFDELADVFSLAASKLEDHDDRTNRSLCLAISSGFESRARKLHLEVQVEEFNQSSPDAEG